MKVKTILVAMVGAALACVGAIVFAPPGQLMPVLGMLLGVVVVLGFLAMLALRREARDRRLATGGMDLEQLRGRPREVSQDDTAW